ncbi:MAG: ElyC/SanA/YdcF family protein [Vicinamibacterales bacterium]|nr:ElyC/SanA/YdcF family protein [Vicinamibacterales bacterium]
MRRPDIVCISSIDWDFIWQGHQEIMSRLAAEGHRVLFVENTGVRPPRLSDLPRLRHRLTNWRRGTKGFREERPNLFVQSPLVLPLPYSRVARWVNRMVMVRGLNRWMRAIGFSRPIVWTFLPTPLAREVIAALDPALTVYYCIDDLASSSPEARRIAASERQLFRDADLVFVTSEKLRARAAEDSERVHLFPFGVNLAAFEQVRTEDAPIPEDLAALPRPVAGYVGGLHQWVDQDLLAAVAERLPDVSFALVGPAQVDVSRLARLPNVHLLGQRAHAEVPRYVKGFDVGLVPYRITEYTANVYPTKLNEYLVMGTPVVATDLAEIRRFNAEHGDVVSIGTTPDEYAAAIRRAIAGAPAAEVARRIEVAESNSWERRLDAMRTLIDEALTVREASRPDWEGRLRRLYSGARRRTVEGLAALLVAYLLVFHTPLVWWLASPLTVTAPPQPADAIVVFAGGVGESGRAGGGFQERVTQAVELYKAGYAPRVVFSSGFVFTMREAEVMRAVAEANGVPRDAIVLEERAANTYENVAFTQDILEARGWRRILLVSSPYHMRRALLTWRHVAPGTEVVPAPVPESQFYARDGWGISLEQIRGLIHEYAAIPYYWWRGWL